MRLPQKDGLNIVPFIDVMLVLLCIVLSISTFIAQGSIKIDLPPSTQATKTNSEKSTNIIIDKDSNIYFDDELVNIESLKEKIGKTRQDELIILRSDKDSKFESFIQVIDILKEKNHENFSITTKINK